MANPNPPEHTRWKKGQSGNPTGRRKLPVSLRSVAELSADEIKRTIAKHFRMNKETLIKVIQNPASPALDLVVASTIAKAIKDGDIAKAEYLFMRSLGKVKDVMEVIQPDPVVIRRPSGEEVELTTQRQE